MKKMDKIALAVAATLFAGSVSAGSLNYRAEYKHDEKTYAQRIKIGESVTVADNTKLSFSVEQKFQSSDATDFWNQMTRGDTEFDWGVRYDINKQWYIQPGMPITFGDERTTYKPQVRVGYKASFGLTTALRYRHEFREYSNSESNGDRGLTDGTSVASAGKTFQEGKLTLTGSYSFSNPDLKNLKLSYEANYIHNYDDVRLFNDTNENWDLGAIVGYQLGDIRPYFEIWNVKGAGSNNDDRQLRTRVGVTYSF
ncbi:oligogalacturonate-specific porin KdgM family protein [uncultured Vibrio sp.]|uniref:oligogalacturonate-specific porin KdgM family protein n=1 Tax=uncultured Vibrio sp. TaxID=114054 RepID=UPI0026067B5A|nr:oligogalacturonate-specific porin KdgM family protein [uncultured Vibrio sp.]